MLVRSILVPLSTEPYSELCNPWSGDLGHRCIDEMVEPDRDLLFSIILDLKKICPALKSMLVGRDEHDIRRTLHTLNPNEVKVTKDLNSEDLHRYIVERVQAWGALGSAKLRNEVIEFLSLKANGLFLWAKLVMDELERIHDESKLRLALTRLPDDMKNLYNTILHEVTLRLEVPELAVFWQIMAWLTLPRSTINLSQLASALSIDDRFTIDSLRLSIPRLYGSLVVIEDFGNGSNSVHLLHASFTDYLSSGDAQCKYSLQKSEAHASMARSCIKQIKDISQCPLFYPIGTSMQYLLSSYHIGRLIGGWNKDGPLVIDANPSNLMDDTCTSHIIYPWVERNFPLLQYAQNYCAYHLEQCAVDPTSGIAIANEFQNLIFAAGPAILIWFTRVTTPVVTHEKVERKEISEQLLRFGQNLQRWSCDTYRVVVDVAAQFAGNGIDGWMFTLGKMTRDHEPIENLGIAVAESLENSLTVPHARQLSQGVILKEEDLASVARSIQQTQDRWLLASFTHRLRGSHSAQQVARFVSSIIRVSLENSTLLEPLAHILFSLGDYAGAVRIYDILHNLEPTRWDLKEAIISANCLSGQVSEAQGLLASFHADYPENAENWCLHAWMEERQAKLSLMTANYRRCLDISENAIDKYPEWWDLWLIKQRVMAEVSETNAEIACLRAAREQPRFTLTASKLLNQRLLENKQYVQALVEASSTIQAFPRSYEANDLLWNCWISSPQFMQSLVFQSLKKVTEVDDPYWISLVHYAKACIQVKLYNEAIEACTACIRMEGSSGLPYYFAAKAYAALDNFPAALDHLCSASTAGLNGASDEMYFEIAYLARKVRRWDALEKALSSVRGDLTPDQGETLALAFLHRGKYLESITLYQSALERLPELDESAQDLASSAHDQSEKGQVIRLQFLQTLALGCQQRYNAAVEKCQFFVTNAILTWYDFAHEYRQLKSYEMACFCFDAGLQDILDSNEEKDNLPDIEKLKHEYYTCGFCERQDFIDTGYTCMECENFDVCAPCLEKALHDHEIGHRLVKCPSSSYPRLKIWLEDGCKRSEPASIVFRKMKPEDVVTTLGRAQ